MHHRKDSNEAGEQLVARTAGNVWQYERFVDDMTGLMVSTEYNAQITLSGILAMVMACVKPIGINYAMFVNPFATNAVKTAQIHIWWYEKIARIDWVQRNSDPPTAYISVVNESSQQFFSSRTLCFSLSQRLRAAVQHWYTTARPQSTLCTHFERSRLLRSGKQLPGHGWRTHIHAPQTFVT